MRGGILDIFPPNHSAPVRIEFFGDMAETIRTFDPLTQRSLQPIDELVLLPSREILLTDEVLDGISPRLKACCDDLEIPANRRRDIMEQLKGAVYFRGVEFLQPLLHPGLETIFEYAPGSALVILDPEAIREAVLRCAQEVIQGEERAREAAMPHSPPAELFITGEELESIIASRSRLELSGLTVGGGGTSIIMPCGENMPLRVTVSRETTHALLPLSQTLQGWLVQGYRVIIASHQLAQAERLKELLEPYKINCMVSEAGFPEAIGVSPANGLPPTGWRRKHYPASW